MLYLVVSYLPWLAFNGDKALCLPRGAGRGPRYRHKFIHQVDPIFLQHNGCFVE